MKEEAVRRKEAQNEENVPAFSENAAASEQPAPAVQDKQAKRARFRKKYFSASAIAKIAMFAALAFAVSYLEFPIFPAASFLQMDFSCVFVLLGGFMFGPVAAVIISGVK